MRMFLLLLAMIPGLILVYYVYRLDKVEREPKNLLLQLFIGGALISIPVYFGEILITKVLLSFLRSGSLAADLIINFIGIALIEETGKYMVMKKCTWQNPEFNYSFDAIVYACVVSMGFAILENVEYVFLHGGLQTALLRAVLTIPGHFVFAIFMGYFYGEAKLTRCHEGTAAGKKVLLKSLGSATLIHGFYDFCLTRPEAIWTIVFFVFLGLLYVYAFNSIRRFSAEDRAIDQCVLDVKPKEDHDSFL